MKQHLDLIDEVRPIKDFIFWENEYPFNPVVSNQIISTMIEKKQFIDIEDRKICIEYSLLKHLSNYSLLGLSYNNMNVDYLRININIPNCYDKYETEVKCLNENEKRKGLLSIYQETILNKAIAYFDTLESIPRGELIFEIGACCNYGSSIKSFQQATTILLDILLFNQNIREDDIKKIFLKNL